MKGKVVCGVPAADKAAGCDSGTRTSMSRVRTFQIILRALICSASRFGRIVLVGVSFTLLLCSTQAMT